MSREADKAFFTSVRFGYDSNSIELLRSQEDSDSLRCLRFENDEEPEEGPWPD